MTVVPLFDWIHKAWTRGRAGVGRATVYAPAPPRSQAALVSEIDAVADAVATARDVDDVLPIIVESAKRFTETEKVVICLVDDADSDRVVIDESNIVVRGPRGILMQDWWGERLPDIIGQVFDQSEMYVETDDARGAWLLAVPVRVAGRRFGVLLAINSIEHRLLPEHSAFLSLLGAFAASAIANAQLVEESRYALLASERGRIAREMHDGISQSLFSIALGVELCKKQLTRDPVGVAERLEDIQGQLASARSELRRYIYDLRPLTLQDLGIVGAIEMWAREVADGHRITVTFDVTGEQYHVGPALEACLYRIAKESVSNVVKHARATTCAINLDYSADQVLLSVTDDGDGFDRGVVEQLALSGVGLGIRSMEDRVMAQGGTFAVLSEPGQGTTVRVALPNGR